MDSMVMIVAMIAIMYFMLIRPENKRKKQAQAMRDGLKKGDLISTIGGIVGKVVFVNSNDTIVIETGEDRVRIELTKWAVSNVVNQADAKKAAPAVEETASVEESASVEAPAAEEETAEN